MHLHDTHFHLDLFEENQKLIEDIERCGIYTIAVTNLPVLFDHTNKLVKNCKYIRAALGFHPELASSRSSQISLFRQQLSETRYIGEVGLDNLYKTAADYSEQKKVFEQIVEACSDFGDKILTVHSRRAEKDVTSIIGSSFPGKIIMHWYSGSLKDLERAIDCGFFFSVNYAMTQSANGQKIISNIPNERILLETDGPYVQLNEIVFTPTMVQDIVKKVNQLKKWGTDINNACEIFHRNFSNIVLSNR